MQISNVFNIQKNHLSKLVEFNISNVHPNPIKVSYYWVVPHLDLLKSKILHNIHDWSNQRHQIPINNYGVTVLIGADMPQLHLQGDTRTGETDDPIAEKFNANGQEKFS